MITDREQAAELRRRRLSAELGLVKGAESTSPAPPVGPRSTLLQQLAELEALASTPDVPIRLIR